MEVHRIVSAEKPCRILTMYIKECAFHEKLFAFDIEFYRHHKSNKIKEIVDNIANLYKDHEENRVEKIAEICDKNFSMQFFDVHNQITKNPMENFINRERMGNFYKFIYNEFNEKMQLKNVAKHENIESTYVAKIIKNETGDTFQTHITIIRVDRSEVLLLGSNMTIQEITDYIGFASYNYFNKSFKKYFGTTPGAYRKKYKNEIWPYGQLTQKKIEEEKLSQKAASRKEGALNDYDRLLQEIKILAKKYSLERAVEFSETEKAQKESGNKDTRQAITHLQIVDKSDIERENYI